MGIEEQILASDRVIVDFWAPWCAPCKTMEPVFERLRAEGHGLCLVDADKNIDLARKYNVGGVPTTILFENGEEKARIVGARSYLALKEELGI